MTTKKELRTYWLEYRLTLSEPQKNEWSSRIQELLFSEFAIQQADNLHVFLPIQERCEVRTWNMIRHIQETMPYVQVSVPRITHAKERTMESVCVDPSTSFVRNRWGIEEPENGYIVPPNSIDLILLPLITFDKKGHRLGYGGGFYDRYLPLCTHATKIGLSYFEPIEAIPEISSFDVKMDFCVTPNKVFRF
jgi:5-formyltetrahydrofolate cyclo-ligase